MSGPKKKKRRTIKMTARVPPNKLKGLFFLLFEGFPATKWEKSKIREYIPSEEDIANFTNHGFLTKAFLTDEIKTRDFYSLGPKGIDLVLAWKVEEATEKGGEIAKETLSLNKTMVLLNIISLVFTVLMLVLVGTTLQINQQTLELNQHTASILESSQPKIDLKLYDYGSISGLQLKQNCFESNNCIEFHPEKIVDAELYDVIVLLVFNNGANAENINIQMIKHPVPITISEELIYGGTEICIDCLDYTEPIPILRVGPKIQISRLTQGESRGFRIYLIDGRQKATFWVSVEGKSIEQFEIIPEKII